MRLLITGATGFVGRNLLLRALAEGQYDEIWLPVRSRKKLEAQFKVDDFDNIPSQVRVIETSAPNWDFSQIPEIDHVIHCAGVLFGRTYEDYQQVHVQGTLNLLKSLKSPKKTIILSSQSAGGPCQASDHTRNESDTDNPITWYGQSKLEMEKVVSVQFPNLDCIFLRPPLILGARDQASLPLFKMVRRPVFFKPSMKEKVYSYICVLDLVAAIFCALDKDWSSLSRHNFFVASDEPVTDESLILQTAQASNRKGVICPVPQGFIKGFAKLVDTIPAWRNAIPSLSKDRVLELWPDRWVVNSNAFKTSFGWQPREDLPGTLSRTRDWYLKTGALRK